MIAGPDSKYMMQWCGRWRPVLNMYDGNNTPTTNVLRVTKVVLWCNEPPDYGFVGCIASPGDLVERMDRNPNARKWDFIR